MLAQPVMVVVFVLDETINLGSNVKLLTADKLNPRGSIVLKVPQRRVLLATEGVERVNPTSEKPKFW